MATGMHHRRCGALLWWWTLLSGGLGTFGAKKKPLFEYDDHYVMLNDYLRNEFYKRALERVVPTCGADCVVLDVGAGSGLLSMMAARLGAPEVLAIEANPALADLAEKTIARNQANFPKSNVTVVAALSSTVSVDQMPRGRQADVLVTETFGTMLLGEGAINFVPDARDRLLKPGGIVIPAGGCQYATLIEIPDFAAASAPATWGKLNLSEFEVLQDTVYWKATMGASRIPFKRLSDRICVLEVDLYRDTRESVALNGTFRVQATQAGVANAVLFDWDIWADASRTDLLSTAPGSRRFAGDVAWGWLLQLQELAGDDWKYGQRPQKIQLSQGEQLDLGVEFIAGGISMHARVRRPLSGQQEASGSPGPLPDHVGSPARIRGVDRGDMVEANEFYLPIVGDLERHAFYEKALLTAVDSKLAAGIKPTVLDCSGGGGVPSMLAATRNGLKALTLAQRTSFAKAVREAAAANGAGELVEAYAVDPRQFLEALLPDDRLADIVVVDPPGTPLRGMSPFAILPDIRQRLLKQDGLVVPSGACLEVGLVDSEELSQLFSVPGASWDGIDLTVWNEEARRQSVLQRFTPYTKWCGAHSTMALKWLSPPRCIFEVDLQEYGRAAVPPNTSSVESLSVTSDGRAHALVGRWKAWPTFTERSSSLGADSDYLGRDLTWPCYVQALAAPGTDLGVIEPVAVAAGETRQLQVTVRQGAGKVTGVAGPEFSFQLIDSGGSPNGRSTGEL